MFPKLTANGMALSLESKFLRCEIVLKMSRYKNADVSVAVDTGSGLITPIVFAANTKGLNEIASTTKALVEKAKSNTLKPQEFQV